MCFTLLSFKSFFFFFEVGVVIQFFLVMSASGFRHNKIIIIIDFIYRGLHIIAQIHY